MKVEEAAANKYAITFGPGAVDTVVADGAARGYGSNVLPRQI
jgi:hypothetical protein